MSIARETMQLFPAGITYKESHNGGSPQHGKQGRVPVIEPKLYQLRQKKASLAYWHKQYVFKSNKAIVIYPCFFLAACMTCIGIITLQILT